MTAKSPTREQRLHGLDALRAGALLLGLFFHATIPYLSRLTDWVVDDASSDLLSLFYFVTHIFRMTLFFMVAGFFARLTVERKGMAGFIRDRGRRIALPFIVFWPISAICIYLEYRWGYAVMLRAGSTGVLHRPDLPVGWTSIPLTHLWFLYFLVIFYANAAVFRSLTSVLERYPAKWKPVRRQKARPIKRLERRSDTTGADGALERRDRSPGDLLDHAFRRLLASRGVVVVLALPLAAAFVVKLKFMDSQGVPAPDHGLIPSFSVLAVYSVPFYFGWFLNRHADLLPLFEGRWRSNLAGAVIFTCLAIGLDIASLPQRGWPWRALFGLLYATATWTWTLGFLGLALRRLSAGSPTIRYVADSSYWIYIVHLPVILALQVVLLPMPWPPMVKFGVIVAVSLPLLFASYHWLVRPTWIGAWLNGRKYPRKMARPALVQVE